MTPICSTCQRECAGAPIEIAPGAFICGDLGECLGPRDGGETRRRNRERESERDRRRQELAAAAAERQYQADLQSIRDQELDEQLDREHDLTCPACSTLRGVVPRVARRIGCRLMKERQQKVEGIHVG